jgi:hypothetical protein
MSTKYSYSRLPPLMDYLYSNPLVPEVIEPLVVIPVGPTPPPIRAKVRMIESSPDPTMGLCRRIARTFDIFLRERTEGWFYRAIDDTWINPDNLIEFIDDLINVVDPMTDIVIKACKTLDREYECSPWTDGGIGWLISRAGVMHVREYDFAGVCGNVFMRHDDTTMGLIACHTFPDHRFWHSWRMPGDPCVRLGITEFNFSKGSQDCPDDDVWPAQKLIVLHTRAVSTLQQVVMIARNITDDIAFAVLGDRFTWCRGVPERLARITSLEEVRRWTPVVKFRKGGQRIEWPASQPTGPWVCQQCVGLRQEQMHRERSRLAEWNRSGWSGFYGR